MRNIFICLAVMLFLFAAEAKEMNVLMIGNSFSVCVGENLSEIVKWSQKHHLRLTSAAIGGCSLETHAGHLKRAEEDPAHKPYIIKVWDSADLSGKETFYGNVLELLKNNKYDVVTIQQASHFSWNYSTYQPYADEIIRCIRKYDPQAEIMIQQTWAYRSDDSRLQPGSGWGFDRHGMHERVRAAYHKLAEEKNLKLIPVGDAIALFRQKIPAYKPLSSKERAEYKYPDLPPQKDDIVGSDFWSRQKDGSMELKTDYIHLNFRGEYLQACVWYAFLFGEDPAAISYEHPKITKEECRDFISAAGEVWRTSKFLQISEQSKK